MPGKLLKNSNVASKAQFEDYLSINRKNIQLAEGNRLNSLKGHITSLEP
jgi:hypothetical protein